MVSLSKTVGLISDQDPSLPIVASQTDSSSTWKTPYLIPPPTPIVHPSTDPSMHLDTLETISTYTADGENEDDDMEIEDVTVMLAPYSSPTVHQQNISQSNPYGSLFSPPPDEDNRSVGNLFTPSPSPQPEPSIHRLRPARIIMSHIQVPPFKRPRSDYRPLPKANTIIVNKPRVPSLPSNLQEVMQTAIQHNAHVGVPSWDSFEKEKKKRRRQENAVAGPSSASHSGADKAAGTKKQLKKRPFVVDDDDDRDPPTKRPRPISERVYVDLTITDDDQPPSLPPPRAIPSTTTLATQNSRHKVKPTLNPLSAKPPQPTTKKSKFVHVIYNPQTDVVTLCLNDIRPVPLEILAHNTRFLRQSLGSNVSETTQVRSEGSSRSVAINRTRRRPCSWSLVANLPPTEDSEEEFSVGGVIREVSEERVEREVIEILTDSDMNVSRKQVGASRPNVTSKTQHRKEPRERQKQPKGRRQAIGDVDRSSSSLNAPLGRIVVSSLPPIPSVIRVIQYPKKARESQQPRKIKQTLDVNGSTSISPTKQVISPPKIKVSSQKPPGERQHPTATHTFPVRPPPSARSSLNSQTLGSGSDDHPNSAAMLSAKALGKRRVISPARSVSATLERQSPFPVPSSYSPPSTRGGIQLSSPNRGSHYPFIAQNNDFNPFVNYPSPVVQSSLVQVNDAEGSIHPSSSSFSGSYNPLDTLASLYDQASSSQTRSDDIHMGGGGSGDSFRQHTSSTTTHSHSLVYNHSQSQSQPQPQADDSLYDDVGLAAAAAAAGDQHDQYDDATTTTATTVDDPWSSLMTTEGQYAYETIDPTLLGGGAALLGEDDADADADADADEEVDMVDSEIEPEFERGLDDQQQDRSELGSKEFSSPPPSSFSSSGSTRAKKKTRSSVSLLEKKNHVPSDDDDDEPSTTRKLLPPRKRTKRVLPDMISHDDIDKLMLSSTVRPTKKRPPSSASDADESSLDSEVDDASDDASDDDDDEDKPTTTTRKPFKPQLSSKRSISVDRKTTTTTTAKPIIDRAHHKQKQDWLMDAVDAFCHQCRRKTFYAKMSCTYCQKMFCVRCYAFRYPDREFDVDMEDYKCPSCEGFCNCTACCRKRGEPYFGVRTRDEVVPVPELQPRPQRLRNANNVERVQVDSPPDLTAIQTTTIPKGVTKVWGSLYGLTGAKIGACLFDPSAQESSVVFAPVTSIAGVAQQAGAGGGAPRNQQRKIRVVKKKKMKRRIYIGAVQACWGYTRPKTRLLKAEPYVKRSYDSMPRYYIGKKKFLFYPIEAEGGEESSLTSIDSEIEEPLATCVAPDPDSLGDGDITRAILLGLNACGVAAVEVSVPAI